MKIVIAGTGKAYWVRLVAKNGAILMASETYFSRSNARRAGRKLADALGLPLEDVTS